VRKYGVGSGAVRTISGTMRLHLDLEERIARFKNVRGVRGVSIRFLPPTPARSPPSSGPKTTLSPMS